KMPVPPLLLAPMPVPHNYYWQDASSTTTTGKMPVPPLLLARCQFHHYYWQDASST
ncbi:MAG: hypothetical protein F6K47_30295, partial [Symploca sp. SIO2E6]|nr:hypothetical protein [Symploca sp. SIO2E6]